MAGLYLFGFLPAGRLPLMLPRGQGNIFYGATASMRGGGLWFAAFE